MKDCSLAQAERIRKAMLPTSMSCYLWAIQSRKTLGDPGRQSGEIVAGQAPFWCRGKTISGADTTHELEETYKAWTAHPDAQTACGFTGEVVECTPPRKHLDMFILVNQSSLIRSTCCRCRWVAALPQRHLRATRGGKRHAMGFGESKGVPLGRGKLRDRANGSRVERAEVVLNIEREKHFVRYLQNYQGEVRSTDIFG